MQRQVAADRLSGFLGDHVAELSEGEQVRPRGQLSVGRRIVKRDAAAPHRGLSGEGENAGQLDTDVALGRRLVPTPEM
jgi:hypothetical protein